MLSHRLGVAPQLGATWKSSKNAQMALKRIRRAFMRATTNLNRLKVASTGKGNQPEFQQGAHWSLCPQGSGLYFRSRVSSRGTISVVVCRVAGFLPSHLADSLMRRPTRPRRRLCLIRMRALHLTRNYARKGVARFEWVSASGSLLRPPALTALARYWRTRRHQACALTSFRRRCSRAPSAHTAALSHTSPQISTGWHEQLQAGSVMTCAANVPNRARNPEEARCRPSRLHSGQGGPRCGTRQSYAAQGAGCRNAVHDEPSAALP